MAKGDMKKGDMKKGDMEKGDMDRTKNGGDWEMQTNK